MLNQKKTFLDPHYLMDEIENISLKFDDFKSKSSMIYKENDRLKRYTSELESKLKDIKSSMIIKEDIKFIDKLSTYIKELKGVKETKILKLKERKYENPLKSKNCYAVLLYLIGKSNKEVIFYEYSAVLGLKHSFRALSVVYAQEYPLLSKYWESAGLDHPVGYYNLGNAYMRGPMRNNMELARFWYHKAANKGCHKSMQKLAWIYGYGYIGTPNYQLAKKWYEMSRAVEKYEKKRTEF